jgi:hypothetical protein
MAWDGLGVYNLNPAYSPETNGAVIDATRYNGLTSDIASGITNALAKDGQNAPTADLTMGGFRVKNIAQPTTTGDALAWAREGNFSSTNSAVLAISSTNVNGGYVSFNNGPTPFGYVGAGGSLITAGTATHMAIRYETSLAFSAGTTRVGWWDSTGALGVGIAPASRFHVQSGGSQASTITNISGLSGSIRLEGTLASAGSDGIAYTSGGGGGAAVVFNRDSGFGTNIGWYVNASANAVAGAMHSEMMLTDAGNLGIGTVPPTYKIDAIGASAPVFRLTDSTGSGVQAYIQANGTSYATFGTLTGHPIYFATGGVTRATIDNNGLITCTGGIAVGNTPTGTASVLDYYLEGTFTPALTGIGAPAMSVAIGEYTRVGNKVKIRISLTWTGGTNGAAISSITGLPFTSFAAIHPFSICCNIAASGLTWASGSPVAYASGSTTINVVAHGSGGTAVSIINVNAGTKDLYIAGEYFVA